MRVLHFQQIEILFPVRALLIQRRGAETGFDPMRNAILADAGLFHVVNIFVAGDGAAPQGTVANSREERFLFARFHAGFDQITHGKK